MANAVPIPEPPGLPFLGNINEFSPENPLADILRLSDTYGRYLSFSKGILVNYRLASF
jgi:cytochrome P450 / NADPH-cytochrome P450 reductase